MIESLVLMYVNKQAWLLCWVSVMLSYIYVDCHSQALSAKCHYANGHYAEYRHAECRKTE